MEPNPQQQKLIDNLDGIYLVDAGAGTGKTFTLTRRYANILDSTNTQPSDILLITFTNNAAQEMKERVINHVDDPDIDALDLQEAPISTFHALCQRILKRDGFKAPELLGLDERIASSTQLIENEVTEREEFDDFWRGFVDRHPEHEEFYQIVRDPRSLLELIRSLSAKGIFPTAEGWYQSGEEYLDGNFSAFKKLFDERNEAPPGKNGPNQSDLLGRVKGVFRKKTYLEDAPERINLPGGRAEKQLDPGFAREAFGEDRGSLKDFVHDVYWGYVGYSLERNYLTFSSLMMFAYVLLCESDEVRDRHSHRYVMVDEFQDTSEIQFKLAMLLAETDNLCVVGDWKQSIYSFQYASVENIQQFQSRLKQYREELTSNRISYSVDEVEGIDLTTNYRSTQSILDFAERSLHQEATGREELDTEAIRDQVVHLEADKPDELTGVEGLKSNREPEAILELIQEVVDNPEYKIRTDEGIRKATFGDVAVLSRTRNFGLELQQKAGKYAIPVAYEGGVEVFKTNPAILLLAWLRVLDDPLSIKGWSVILERAGYTLPEIESMIPEEERARDLGESSGDGETLGPEDPSGADFTLPYSMRDFRERLLKSESVAETARLVFDRYNVRSGFADRIIGILHRTFSEQYTNRGDLIRFVEENVESGSTYEVDSALEADTVTVQTIHAAKGLEYPIVILADMNYHRFPGISRGAPAVDYMDPVGLRQRKIYRDDGTPFNYDNWRTDVLSRCLTGEYDEERRLLYVALTRAEHYLFLSAEQDRSGAFFEGMVDAIPLREVTDPSPQEVKAEPEERTDLEVETPDRRAPGKRSVHDLMNEAVFEEAESTRGQKLGSSVHEFAERYLKDRSTGPTEPGLEDKRNLREFLEELDGTKRAEVPCSLPLTTGQRRIVVNGVIDLIHETEDSVEIIDYKTDLEPVAEEEYRKQLSVYYHAVEGYYNDDRSVSMSLFYTSSNTVRELEPLSVDRLKALVKDKF